MAPGRARGPHGIGAHAVGVTHKFSERLVSPFQPLANLLKACRRGLRDLAARLAEL